MTITRSSRHHALILDGVITVLVGVLVFVIMPFAAMGVPGRHELDAPAYALLTLIVAPLLVRRLWPEMVLVVSVVASAAYIAFGYPPGPLFIAPAIAMYTLAVRVPLRRSLLACGLAVFALTAGNTPELIGLSGGEVLDELQGRMPWAVGWLALPWAVGTVMRLAREEATRTREEEGRRRVYEERLRVAREVHDVVGHGLAVINMQAGIALHVLAKRRAGGATTNGGPADQAEAALEAIRSTSKEALDELRGTLAVFRRPDGDEAAPRRPAPGLGQLQALVSEMAESGLPVRLAISGAASELPGGVDLAAYRIVQESLTNVLRHAGGAAATVRVSYEPGEVTVEVTDDGNGRVPVTTGRGGHGIVGMRERAAAVGGTLEAAPRPQGGFRVHARLPARQESR
jgi:signal transduction histidine kinase